MHIYVAGELIKSTGAHPFWVVGKGWTHARDLHVGMHLQSQDGKSLCIEEVEKIDLAEPEDTYNFEVSEVHNYFAGTATMAVLVHNAEFRESVYYVDPWDIAFSRNPDYIKGTDTFGRAGLETTTLNEAVEKSRQLGRMMDGLAIEVDWRVDYSLEPAEFWQSANNRTLWVAQETGLREIPVRQTVRAATGINNHIEMTNGGVFRRSPYCSY